MGRLKVTRRDCARLARVAVFAGVAIAGVGCAENTPAAHPNPVVGAPGAGAPGTGTAGVPGTGTAGTPGVNMMLPVGGAAGGGAVEPGGPNATGSPLPCAVNTVVKSRCGNCHGASAVGGAPMSLATHADFHKDHKSVTTMPGVTKKAYEWVKIRINDAMKPMPGGRMLEGTELSTMNTWLNAQAPAPGSGDACQTGGPTAGSGGSVSAGAGGAGGTGGTHPPSECDAGGAFEPLVPRDGETCYDFLVHGQSSPDDTTKFSVQVDESYNQFYYNVPWPAGSMATRFGAKFDNLKVLHHWLAFATDAGFAAGTVSRNVLGTTIGENAQLIGGWAVGGCNVEFPPEMGLKLPSTGKIMVQWHHYNFSGMPQPDGSKVQICTLPAGARPNLGGLTWLGTENMTVLPGQKSDAVGTCVNDSPGDVNIVAFWPHMHEIGINMKSEVQKAGTGAWTTVFDKPFDFNYQVHYNQKPHVVLKPGDSIRSTCTYMNGTALPVGFGQSTKAEMCYQFAFSYPAGALDNAVPSLIGATNTCWQFGE